MSHGCMALTVLLVGFKPAFFVADFHMNPAHIPHIKIVPAEIEMSTICSKSLSSLPVLGYTT